MPDPTRTPPTPYPESTPNDTLAPAHRSRASQVHTSQAYYTQLVETSSARSHESRYSDPPARFGSDEGALLKQARRWTREDLRTLIQKGRHVSSTRARRHLQYGMRRRAFRDRWDGEADSSNAAPDACDCRAERAKALEQNPRQADCV